jgi:hypothetical protein
MPLISLDIAKSASHPKVHLVISSANVTRMKIPLWKRCRKHRKIHKVCSTNLLITHTVSSSHNIYWLPLALTFWQPSTPSQRERTRKFSLSSCPPTPQHPPALHSPPPTKRPRRGTEPVPGSTSAVSPPASSRYKCAGGSDGKLPALNAEFEIDPAANGGVPFAFDEVVRGRRHRHGLDAGECEECRGVGALLPSPSQSPILTVVVVVCRCGAAPTASRSAAMELASFTPTIVAHPRRVRVSSVPRL